MCSGGVIPSEDLSRIVETGDCGLCLCGSESRDSVVSQSIVRFTMTTEDTSDDEISSTEEFEVALGRVIRDAFENGVNPRGTWEYRSDRAGADVEVMVVELAD